MREEEQQVESGRDGEEVGGMRRQAGTWLEGWLRGRPKPFQPCLLDRSSNLLSAEGSAQLTRPLFYCRPVLQQKQLEVTGL